MKITLLVILLLLQAFPAQVQGAFYQWVDGQGVTHFTDDQEKIPSQYRARAKELKLLETPAVSRPAPNPAPPEQAARAKAAANPGGQTEEWWRERFSELRGELKELQDGLPDKQTKVAELRRKRAIYTRAQDRVALNAMRDAISADETRIAELQKQLAELELRATQAGVPVEWRQ